MVYPGVYDNYTNVMLVLDNPESALAKNASKTYSLSVSVPTAVQDILDARGIRQYTPELHVLLLNTYMEPWWGYATPGIQFIDMRYAPSIPTFTVKRSPNADSTGASVGLKCTLASGADPEYEDLALTLKWKEDGAASFPAGNTLAVTVADALASGRTTVTPSFTFETGKAYTLRATFTDGIDSAVSETKLSKAKKTLNVHPTSKNIGLGQFAVADLDADDVMRMDTVYRPYFHEGVGAMTKAHIIAMLGIQTGRSGATDGLAANATTDVTVTFPTEYKEVPLLFMYPDSEHTPASVGSLLFTLVKDSLTASGFKVRWFNNTSYVRYININWTAMGELDT